MEYVERRVAWSDMLLWLEGKSFPLGVSKAFREADIDYNPKGTPVFFTGGRRLHHPDPLKHAMMDSRMNYVEFFYSMPKEVIQQKERAGLRDCGRCFARFILGDPAEEDTDDILGDPAQEDTDDDIVDRHIHHCTIFFTKAKERGLQFKLIKCRSVWRFCI